MNTSTWHCVLYISVITYQKWIVVVFWLVLGFFCLGFFLCLFLLIFFCCFVWGFFGVWVCFSFYPHTPLTPSREDNLGSLTIIFLSLVGLLLSFFPRLFFSELSVHQLYVKAFLHRFFHGNKPAFPASSIGIGLIHPSGLCYQ